jgi:hypothetical protein
MMSEQKPRFKPEPSRKAGGFALLPESVGYPHKNCSNFPDEKKGQLS